MKITFIYHSCFVVEFEREILVFDYFKGKLPEFSKEKRIYFFASHKHHDHFSLSIFEYADKYPNVKFILGSDIRLNEKYLLRKGIDPKRTEQIVRAGRNQSFRVDGLEIETLKSTDEGVAYIVACGGKLIYHAGDLNWWHWHGEPGSFNADMERDYKAQLDLIAGRSFDAAFVPLDPRLGEAYDWGLCYFAEKIRAEYIFPMHMWDKYPVIQKLKEQENVLSYKDKIADIFAPMQEFLIVD